MKWKRKRDRARIVYTGNKNGFRIELINWPGSRTCEFEIFNLVNSPIHHETKDKAEYTISILKESALEWLDGYFKSNNINFHENKTI